jgi:hypothetical protein
VASGCGRQVPSAIDTCVKRWQSRIVGEVSLTTCLQAVKHRRIKTNNRTAAPVMMKNTGFLINDSMSYFGGRARPR